MGGTQSWQTGIILADSGAWGCPELSSPWSWDDWKQVNSGSKCGVPWRRCSGCGAGVAGL